MKKPIIHVNNISKLYLLGEKTNINGVNTFRDVFDKSLRKIIKKERNVTDYDNHLWALKDVTFEVDEGDVIGIIGRNGAGKSTLLKILSRITRPTKGSITMRGRVSSLLEIGTGFNPELTGRENIFLNGSILGMQKKEIIKKFDEIVAFAEVEKFIDTPVKRYSSGMYVRLAFAVAAHLDPEILIVDEVLSVGDTHFQKKCMGQMENASHKEGKTVLFVSHNMAAIKQLCPKSIILHRGEIKAYGESINIINEYINEGEKISSCIDLSSFSNRNGSKDILFKSALLCTNNGIVKKEYSIGENLNIIFDVVSKKSYIKAKFAVEIRSSDGIKICNMVDTDSNFEINYVESIMKIKVQLNDIRLYPDTYYISLWVGSCNSNDDYDYVHDCLAFKVIDGGTLTMRNLPRSTGLIFLTPIWEKL